MIRAIGQSGFMLQVTGPDNSPPEPRRWSSWPDWKQVGRAVLDAVLPPQCAACGEPTGTGGGVCPACWARIDFIERPLCPRLGLPLPYDVGEGALSAEAIARPPPYDRARAVARFDGVARQLVHALKYGDRLECAPLMGEWMARAGRELLDRADILVPVPLYPTRLWWRRCNQSALLARGLSLRCGLNVANRALVRRRHTRKQVGLSAAQRRRNVAGAFAVTPAGVRAIRGRSVVLVDDVLTTGATIGACTRTLRRAGAAHIDVLVFARVVDPVRLPVG